MLRLVVFTPVLRDNINPVLKAESGGWKEVLSTAYLEYLVMWLVLFGYKHTVKTVCQARVTGHSAFHKHHLMFGLERPELKLSLWTLFMFAASQ